MVTKGIIKSIDYNGNTCKVRVPILESACDDAEIVLSAIFATAPGIFNGYKEEDVVIVSFEDNNYENAIILGKLYLGASKENEDPRGTVSCANLKSENQATIPLSSKLVYDAKDKNTANVKGSYNDYKTLADIVDGLQTQKTEIGSLNVKIIDDGEQLGARVSKVEEDNVEQASELALHSNEINMRVTKKSPDKCDGFGWLMDENGIVFESALGKKDENDKYVENKTEVLKIDANGATITGKLTVKDKGDTKNNIEPRIIFEADPFGKPASGEEKEIKPHVLIGGWDADHNSLGLIDENGERLKIGDPNGVTISSGINDKAVSIAKSKDKNDWCFVASNKFGVDKSGKAYMSDINIDGIEFDTSHSEPKYFIIDVKATAAGNGVQFTATSDDLLENDTDINITYFKSSDKSNDQPLLTTVTILAGESKGSTVVEDAKTGEGDFSWDPKYVDSTLGDFFNAYGYFNDKNKMHCAGYSFDLIPGGHGGNWDKAKLKTVSWYRTTWELINNSTMNKKLVALNNARWVTNDDVVCHAIDKHEFTEIHSIIEQWNSTKQHGIVAKTYASTKIIAQGNATSNGLIASLSYRSGYTGDTRISISFDGPNIDSKIIDETEKNGTCIMTINGETITLKGKCRKFGTSSSYSYESDLTGTSSNTGKSYNLIVSRFLIAPMYDLGGGIGPGPSNNSNQKATLTEIDNNSRELDINTAKLITINPQFSLEHVDDSNEDVIYLYSKISNVPQIDVKNDDEQSALYRFIPLSSDISITSIDLSESDFIDFSLESGESARARYFIFDDDKLNIFIYGKNYSSIWGQAKQTIDIEIAANTERTTVEKTVKLEHTPQEILGIDIDDSKAADLIWSSVHSYVENDEIKIKLVSVSNNKSDDKIIKVIVNYTWQQEI